MSRKICFVASGCKEAHCRLLAFAHRQGDPVSLPVDFHDSNLDFLADFHYFARIFNKTVGQLTDMNEAVLLDTDIGKGAKFE